MAEDRVPGLTGNTLTPLSISGMPVEALQRAMADNPDTFDVAQETSGSSHFWSCWPRPWDDRTRDVLDLGLGSVRLINKIRFQVSQFPCTVTVEHQDPQDMRWKPVHDYHTHKPVAIQVINSVPSVLKTGVTSNLKVHPQHVGAGHWLPIEVRMRPVTASRIRLLLRRTGNLTNVPRSLRAEPVPYSLGIRDFEVGYEVSDRADFTGIAQTGQDSSRLAALSTAQDLLGSQTSFVVRETRASHVLEGLRELSRPAEERVAAQYVWKSEAQPISEAVVNFYLDLRDQDGASIPLDRIWLDPITSGVAMRVYYSEHVPQSPGRVPEATEFLSPYMASDEGSNVALNEEGVFFGSGAPAYLDIDNTVVQWNREQPWWFGLEAQPQFNSDDTGTWYLLDTREVKVWWEDSVFKIRVFNETTQFPVTTFQSNQQTRFLVGWDGTSVTIKLPNQSAFYTASGTEMVTDQTRLIRFGGQASNLAADPGRGNYRLNGFFLKQTDPEDGDTQAFFNEQGDFYRGWADDSRTLDSILRIHPTLRDLALDSSPYGIVGGSPLGFYEAVQWKPVNRTFRLERGYIDINPIRAKYLKFEFTNLAPQPYVASHPVNIWVKQYPNPLSGRAGRFPPFPRPQTLSLAGSGGTVNQALAKVKYFLDQNGLMAANRPEYADYAPTEALYSPSLEVQDRLKALNPMFGLIPWNQGLTPAGFTAEGVHIYHETLVRTENKVSFFVGLKTVRVYRTDYTAVEDAESYLFDFYDAQHLVDEPSGWGFEPPEFSGLTIRTDWVGSAAARRSEVLPSKQRVRGLQFASVQSPARQRLSDPEFTDPTLHRWAAYEGAHISISGDFNADLGSLLKVERYPDGAYYGYLELRGTWEMIEGYDPVTHLDSDPLHPTWEEFAADPAIGASSGGVQGTEKIDLPTRGRVYASARVYAPKPLTAPLHIQIIGIDNEILADAMTVPHPHQIIEWFATYTIGESGTDEEEQALSWDDIEGHDPETHIDPDPVRPNWDEVEDTGTWTDVATGGHGFYTYDSQVTVRLYQEGLSVDTFYVDSITLYEDPIVWEFSNDGGGHYYPVYDIRNDPNGAFLFPETGAAEENELRFRLIGARPDLHVTSLLIRPWYATRPMAMGVPSPEPLNHGGPHDNYYDQYPSVFDSPHFKAWDKPIPEDWWSSFRRAAPIRALPPQPPTTPTHLRLSEPPSVPVAFLVANP